MHMDWVGALGGGSSVGAASGDALFISLCVGGALLLGRAGAANSWQTKKITLAREGVSGSAQFLKHVPNFDPEWSSAGVPVSGTNLFLNLPHSTRHLKYGSFFHIGGYAHMQ